MASDCPVRPPTILSEYGEGYCRHCHFIEGLTFQGLLAEHYRGKIMNTYGADSRKPCKGSLKTPAKITPWASRKAAFRVRQPVAPCSVCRTGVALYTGSTFATSVVDRHHYCGSPCPGSFRPPLVR